jgi:hypothetical protein
MMQIVQLCFKEYPMDKLDGIWGCLFNNFRSIMACDGGNQYLKAHNQYISQRNFGWPNVQHGGLFEVP